MAGLTLIKGGLEDNSRPEYNFIDAAVTDTRLMGVLGLRVHWLETAGGQSHHVYTFFYYDIEELGLDSISVYELYDQEAIDLATKSCFGGLGAKMQPVDEKEAKYLIRSFASGTREKGQEMPENSDIIDDLHVEEAALSLEELDALNDKMCVPRVTSYGTVNYYLMRCFGKDTEGADMLKAKGAPADAFDDISFETHATFLRNSVEPYYNQDDTLSYLSESLVETGNSHYIVTSEIRLENGKVREARLKSRFCISVEEASLLLARGEFCTVYRIVCPMEDFDIDFASFSIGTTRTEHETGNMFMEFKPDNSHADCSEFRLYEDINALYFVSDYGELIVAAYSNDEIKAVENRIRNSVLKPDVKIMIKIQLARSVIYEYAESGYTNFGQFIRSLE